MLHQITPTRDNTALRGEIVRAVHLVGLFIAQVNIPAILAVLADDDVAHVSELAPCELRRLIAVATYGDEELLPVPFTLEPELVLEEEEVPRPEVVFESLEPKRRAGYTGQPALFEAGAA